MTYKKKLIEVALPLEAINREAAREKSIQRGHPSTLHLWWARRPLADDPSEDMAELPEGLGERLDRDLTLSGKFRSKIAPLRVRNHTRCGGVEASGPRTSGAPTSLS